MKSIFILLLAVISLHARETVAQTAIQTSFETAQGYSAGNLHSQNAWLLSAGTAVVNTAKAKNGIQSVQMSATGTALLLNHVAYSGTVPGIKGEVYADMWVNPTSFLTKGIAIHGMDLYGGSSKRIFVIEFGTDGNIKAYNGSSAANVATWAANTWVRISIKMDFATEKYKVAINAAVNATDFAFREAYVPTASGTRVAGVKEFHSLRINHTADATVATTDAALDDLYVGTTPISDVSFGGGSTIRTITVNQPDYGNISLSPAAPYNIGQNVTATLTVPAGYLNTGWTGALSGTELIKTITVADNISIGADVEIDSNNPPPKYLVTVTQPANGNIVLSPASADNRYYKETQVTATVSYETCYQFDGWAGDLSGTEITKTFTVQNDISFAANISLNNIAPTKRAVNSVVSFKAALAAMNPGDTVELDNGTYDLSSLTITRSGCQLRPIVIMARNKGQAIFNGATALVFRNMQYATFRGFAMRSTGVGTGIKLENCSKFRITENSFALVETGSCTWINIGDTYASPIPIRSGYNRVDHNSFDGKTQAGNYIRMDGNINQQSQYDTIDHNHFKNNGPRADNEKETIRVGVSTLSKSSGFTLIEYNLFEDCDGDPEIVSVKSCDNTIRYNTFVRSLGTLCLRQGFRSRVEGNYFFGDNKTGTYNGGTIGAGGVRVYGKDHLIVNNYFSGLTGAKWDAAITLTNGDVDNSSASVAEHYLPENIRVAYNTLVNNRSDIEIGFDNNGNYPLSPINCVIENNIVIENANPIVKAHNAAALNGVSFLNNIMYPTGTSSVGITANAAAINVVDPQLVLPVCTAPANCAQSNASKVYRLSATSPAINAGIGSYASVVVDNELQTRDGLKDIGADEFTSASPVTVALSALDASQVGPDAVATTYTYVLSGVLPLHLLQFNATKYNGASRLVWATTGEENEQRYEVEWSSNGSQFSSIGAVSARGNINLQQYYFDDPTHTKGKNFYRLKIVNLDGRYTYSSIAVLDFGLAAQVYPNPAKDRLFVEMDLNSAQQVNLQLMSSDGRVVKSLKERQSALLSISVSDLPAGIYFLRVNTEGGMLLNKRIMIVK